MWRTTKVTRHTYFFLSHWVLWAERSCSETGGLLARLQNCPAYVRWVCCLSLPTALTNMCLDRYRLRGRQPAEIEERTKLPCIRHIAAGKHVSFAMVYHEVRRNARS